MPTVKEKTGRMKARSRQTNKPRLSTKKIRYAVVGLGYISQSNVLPAFRNAHKNSELVALVSGDPVKLKELSRKYKCKWAVAYDQYEELLRSGEIDAVYIALPNDMHREYTVKAAQSGIHVLCEKPLAVTEDECQEMIEACRANHVKLMTAYRLHFEEANLKAIELAQSGKLGKLRIFDSLFTMQVRDPSNYRLQRKKGGGTLYDIGIYCINAARYLFQSEPEEVFCCTSNSGDERFTEIEEMASAILRFPEDRLASFTCSFGADDRACYEIVGTKGSMRMEEAYEIAMRKTHRLSVHGKVSKKTFSKRDQFGPELLYFSNCILNDQEPEPNGLEGLADVRIIQALYQSAETGQPVSVQPVAKEVYPSESQEIDVPPISEPHLFHATSPSGG